MARPIIRPAPIYYGTRKVAEIQEGNYELASNDQLEIGAEGYIGHTDGATTSKIEMTLVVPVGGVTPTMLVDMLNKQYVKIGLVEDGKSHRLEGRIVTIRYQWDHKQGQNRLTGTFESGEPEVT